MAIFRLLPISPNTGIFTTVPCGVFEIMDDKRDVAFDILLNLVDFTFNRNLPLTSLKIEAALDTFLEETGRATKNSDPEDPDDQEVSVGAFQDAARSNEGPAAEI